MSRLPSPLAWHPLLTLGFGTPHAKILHVVAGWGPGQGLAGHSTQPAAAPHPAAPLSTRSNGVCPGGGQCHLTGDIRMRRDLVSCRQTPRTPQRGVKSCCLYSLPGPSVFSCKSRQASSNPLLASRFASPIPSFSPRTRGREMLAGCSCQHGLLEPVWVFYATLAANISLGYTRLGANTRLGAGLLRRAPGAKQRQKEKHQSMKNRSREKQPPCPDLTNRQPETRNCPVAKPSGVRRKQHPLPNGSGGCGKEREVPSVVKERPAARGGTAATAEGAGMRGDPLRAAGAAPAQ